jgi:hypothetical protein
MILIDMRWNKLGECMTPLFFLSRMDSQEFQSMMIVVGFIYPIKLESVIFKNNFSVKIEGLKVDNHLFRNAEVSSNVV